MRLPACLLLLALLLSGTGCPPPAARPYPPPQPAELLAHLRQRAAQLTSLRARAKADYLDGTNRVKATLGVLAARPGRLRIAAENALAGPLLTLVTDGQDFALLDVRNNRFLAGPATPCNIARLLGLALEPQAVVAVLLGGAPLLEPASAQVGWDGKDGGREVLTLRAADGRTEIIELSAKDRAWDLRSAELRDPGGTLVWRVRHDDFAAFELRNPAIPGPPLRLPAVTTIDEPARRGDVRLRWRERELNPDLPADAFHLAPPPGVAVEAAQCGSG